jgi:hypothetical protein
MMVQLVEVLRAALEENSYGRRLLGQGSQAGPIYELRQISINPSWVVHVRPDQVMKGNLNEGLLPEDLDKRSEFTRVLLNSGQHGEEVTVVGSTSSIREKLNKGVRHLLKG